MRRPSACSMRVRSVIGIPGNPNTVSMPFSLSASITRWKPSIVSCACGAPAAVAGCAVGWVAAGGVTVAMVEFLRGIAPRRQCAAGLAEIRASVSSYNVKKMPVRATLIRVKFAPGIRSSEMTLLANHPDAAEIRERLHQNIVLRRLEKRAFDELTALLAVVDYRKGDVLLSQGAH